MLLHNSPFSIWWEINLLKQAQNSGMGLFLLRTDWSWPPISDPMIGIEHHPYKKPGSTRLRRNPNPLAHQHTHLSVVPLPPSDLHAAPLPWRTAAGPPSSTTISPATGVRSRTRPAPVRWPAASSSPRVRVPEPDARLLLVVEETDSGSRQRAPRPPDTMGDPTAADLLSTRRPPSDPVTNVVLAPPPLNSRRCSMAAASRWWYAQQVIHGELLDNPCIELFCSEQTPLLLPVGCMAPLDLAR